MRIFGAILLAVLPIGSAVAQVVDCEKLASTKAPFEMTATEVVETNGRTTTKTKTKTYHVYRNAGGYNVTYIRHDGEEKFTKNTLLFGTGVAMQTMGLDRKPIADTVTDLRPLPTDDPRAARKPYSFDAVQTRRLDPGTDPKKIVYSGEFVEPRAKFLGPCRLGVNIYRSSVKYEDRPEATTTYEAAYSPELAMSLDTTFKIKLPGSGMQTMTVTFDDPRFSFSPFPIE